MSLYSIKVAVKDKEGDNDIYLEFKQDYPGDIGGRVLDFYNTLKETPGSDIICADERCKEKVLNEAIETIINEYGRYIIIDDGQIVSVDSDYFFK